jgi:hypothetical protein
LREQIDKSDLALALENRVGSLDNGDGKTERGLERGLLGPLLEKSGRPVLRDVVRTGLKSKNIGRRQFWQ